jgi:hypothetical protein
MKETFAAIYDTLFGIYNTQFYLIFQHLFDNGGYIKLGFSFILIPLICWVIFYYIWKYPYGKLWHWLVLMVITMLILFVTSYSIAYSEILESNNQALNDAIADASTGYEEYAASLPVKYACANSFLALITGFIYSLIMKQFSKIQIHLPF